MGKSPIYKLSITAENKINNAVDRLNKILPLKKSQLLLSPKINQLSQDVLFSYIDIGRSLNRDEMADRIENVSEAVDVLREKDLLVFDDSGEPVGAYPFTMESRVHKLRVNGHLLHCMCALDSLAVSPMFKKPVEITSRCHVSEQEVFVKQSAFEVLNAEEVEDIFFGINWGSASNTCSCANSLCAEMIFLKGEQVMSDWMNADPDNREIFKLNEAIEFAARFFVPVLE